MTSCRLIVVSSFAIWTLAASLMAFSGGPLPRLTGGFQEQTCVSCHNTFALNEGRTRGGVFYIAGVPRDYVAGQSYPISVVIGHPGQSRWGFELSVRSASSGQQAGELEPLDETTQLKEAGGVSYIEHTEAGSRQGRAVDGRLEFRFNWTAPDPSAGSVYFNAAGNSADSSGDPSGDYIYTAGAHSATSGAPETPMTTQIQERGTQRINTASRFMHIPAPRDLDKGDREFHVEHRFLMPVLDSRPGNAFGIDSGANINLAFNYAMTDEVTVGVSRARWPWPRFGDGGVTVFKGIYEVHHDQESLWKMSLVGGVEAQQNFLRHYSPFIQLPAAFDYKRLRAYVVPTVVFNSRRDEDFLSPLPFGAVNPDDNHTFSLGLGADLALHRRFSLAGEYVPRLVGFGGLGNERSTLAWGAKLRTFGHVFTIMMTNNRNFTPAGYAVNAGTTDFALAFNIYRRF